MVYYVYNKEGKKETVNAIKAVEPIRKKLRCEPCKKLCLITQYKKCLTDYYNNVIKK